MAIASDSNVHGRMRQRIVTVGRVDRKGVLARGAARFTRDKHLRAFLQSGAVTHEQLEAAISGFSRAPSDFVWLAGVDGAVLGTADRVFLAKHGRAPVENADFRLNGDYHKICRSLQHDVHHYDSFLEESSRVKQPEVQAQAREPSQICREEPPQVEPLKVQSRAKEPKQVRREKPKKKTLWPFVAVLVFGFFSAPLLAVIISTYSSGQDLTVGLLAGSLWLLILLGALVLTFPREAN
jgi:hypothetical protein